MATEPSDRLDGQVSRSRARAGVGEAPGSSTSAPSERKAPRAEPEEDIEEWEAEPGDQETLCENPTPVGDEEGDESQMENQESKTAIPDTYPPTHPPLPPPQVRDCISDIGIILDSSEDLVSADEEWTKASRSTEPVHQEVESESEETRTTSDEPQHEAPEDAGHSSSDGSNNSNNEFSPPFADESEEEEVNTEGETLDKSGQTLPAPPPVQHQGELLHQGPRALARQRAKQEAAQQVQGSAPLSTVAMEPANGGGAASQDFGCVDALRQRQSRVGRSTEVEREQTGGQQGQTERAAERREQHTKVLSTVRVQEPSMTQTFSQGEYLKYRSHGKTETDSYDDSHSDSGLSEDFSPLSTMEAKRSSGTPAKETPIEREIRRAVEREDSLRRSRGFQNQPGSPEYVEVPLRKSPPLTQSPSKSDKCKDREYAGKKMQQEILEELQREQDLVKLGKVPGIYDKGTVRQLKEKKRIFEAFQQPCDSEPTRRKSWSSASSSCSSSSSSSSSSAGTSSTSTMRSVGASSPSEFPGSQVIIRGNVPSQKLLRAVSENGPLTTVEGPKRFSGSSRWLQEQMEEEEEPKNNPFFMLRSSSSVEVEQDIRETQEREKELRKQRTSLYGEERVEKGKEAKRGVKGTKEPTSPQNGLKQPTSTWSPRPSAGQHSPTGKLNAWPPAQDDEDERTTQHKMTLSPRSPRQKTPLVERWESGQINGHHQADD